MAFRGTINPFANQLAYSQNLQNAIMPMLGFMDRRNQQKLAGRELAQALQFGNQRGNEYTDPNFMGPPTPIPEFQTAPAQNALAQVLLPERYSPYQKLADLRVNEYNRTGDPRFLGAAGTTVNIGPDAITDPQIAGVSKLVTKGIDAASRKGVMNTWGRKNFLEENTKAAWDNVKRLTRFGTRTDEDKRFIFEDFKTQLHGWAGGNEAEWDDSWFGSDMPKAEPSGGMSTNKSPYPDYPDAFQENGVWKVTRNGKKYRIED